MNAEAAVKSLLANPPVSIVAKLAPSDLLLTTSENRVIEMKPDGTFGQSIHKLLSKPKVTENPMGNAGKRDKMVVSAAHLTEMQGGKRMFFV